VDQVLAVIQDAGLQPGQALPPERELAARIGVSRNVLREGFRVLEDWGLVDSRQGSGRYLRQLPSSVPALSTQASQLEIASIADVLESRALIEDRIVVLACQRRTLPEARRITLLAQRLSSWEDNFDFHVAVATATHNFMLERMLREHMQVLSDLHQREHYQSPEAAQVLISEHRILADAIFARDEPAAQELLNRHLRHTRRSVGLGDGGHAPGELDRS
jgi:DNA-binding FadR family transcriptional regulator